MTIGTRIAIALFGCVISWAQANIPVAKYDEAGALRPHTLTAEDNARHVRRDAYYDRRTFGPLKALDHKGGGIEIITHWDVRLPAIPVEQSDLVVLAEVVVAEARVSQSRLSVYSEFTLSVNSVLKDATERIIAPGNTITADRHIGGVEFATGTIAYYHEVHMGAPEAGKNYILFLKTDESGDLTIVTGFELEGGKVYAMDGARATAQPHGQVTRFDTYNGTDQNRFMELVRKQVTKSR